jgi:hypothetical protein
MKYNAIALLIASAILTTISLQIQTAFAQGTAFTYQGQIESNGALASGTYNLTFTLFTNSTGGTAVAGPVTNSANLVTNGLFTVTVDFGGAVWNGVTNWLQIGVETNGGTGFTPLNPRQEVTPAPYAIFAEGANAAGLSGTLPMSSLSGTYGGALNLSNGGNLFTGNGTGLTNVNATALDGLAAAGFWQLGGNTNVPTGSNVIGTLNNQFLDVRVSNVRVMRLRLFTDGQGLYTNAPNVIGGSSVNLTAPNVVGATIAGGGGNGTNGNSLVNEVSADFGTIGGGANNSAGSQGATVCGGIGNTANNVYAVVSGGLSNNASGVNSFIGGGLGNDATFNYATVGGGSGNTASSEASTVGGGLNNSAAGFFGYVTVGGGFANTASGAGSFIGGGGVDGSIFSGNNSQDAATTIGGGLGNSIPIGGTYAVIGGGYFNTNSGNSAVIGGGSDNIISASGTYAFIGGGTGNSATNEFATVAGGTGNTAYGLNATVGGGWGNNASGNGATIAGGGSFGDGNTASGQFSTVGGGTQNNAYLGYARINSKFKPGAESIWQSPAVQV